MEHDQGEHFTDRPKKPQSGQDMLDTLAKTHLSGEAIRGQVIVRIVLGVLFLGGSLTYLAYLVFRHFNGSEPSFFGHLEALLPIVGSLMGYLQLRIGWTSWKAIR